MGKGSYSNFHVFFLWQSLQGEYKMPQHDSILMTAAVTEMGNNKQPILDLQFLGGNHFHNPFWIQ